MSGTPDVWHLIAPAPFGGAETVVESLAAARVEQGRATGAILLAPDGPLPIAERLAAAGVQVERIRSAGRNYGAQVAGIVEVLRRHPALLHTHGYQADVLGVRAARAAKSVVLATNHGYAGGDLKNRFYEWLDRRALRRMSTVIAVSSRNAERLRAWGHPDERLVVIPNGWRPGPAMSREAARAALAVAPGANVIGWIGRISHEKGLDQLLDAVKLLPPRSAEIVIIGDGPSRAAAEAQAAALGIAESLRFVGARADAAALCAAFDVLAISSRTEGLPMVLLEATAAGVPIVSFAVGGIPEVLDASSAWLVTPGDATAMAESLRSALADAESRRARLEVARRLLDARLGAAQWVAAHEVIYDGLRARMR